jgi:hypothetical protein
MIHFIKSLNPFTGSQGSRAEMEIHSSLLPAAIRDELKKGNLRLADAVIYSLKQLTSTTVKMFEAKDDREIGYRNIAGGKLPKNQCLLLSGIRLMIVRAGAVDKDTVLSGPNLPIESFYETINGEFSLKVGG